MNKCKICKTDFKIKSYYCSKDCQSKDWILHKALHKEKAQALLNGISEDPVSDDVDENGMSTLMKLCYEGDWKAVEKLMKAGVDATAVDKQGLTALSYAISGRRPKVVSVLCKYAPPSLITMGPPSWKNASCLAQACFIGHLEILKILASTGGPESLLTTDADGRTCLHTACKFGHVELVHYLLSAGGRDLLFRQDIDGRTCLFAAIEDSRAEICRVLIEVGGEALLRVRDVCGNSCVYCACFKGSPNVMRVFVKAVGPRLVEILADDSSSGLMQACAAGHAAVVDIILALPGAAPLLRRVGAEGCCCVHGAADSGHAGLLRSVLRVGGADQASLTCSGELRITPLHVAAAKDRAEAVQVLLAAVDDDSARERLLHMPKNDGDTALHVAASLGHISTVRVLLRAGGAALACALNPQKGTPLHSVCAAGRDRPGTAEVAEMVLAVGGRGLLVRPDIQGSLPVHLACMRGSVGPLQVLGRVGGPRYLRVRDSRGVTPMELATATGQHEAVQVPAVRAF